MLVQFWRSFEDLDHFAHNPADPHLSPWRAFMKTQGDGSVGIWHETYLVHTGEFEAVYSGMPRFGLASALEHVAISQKKNTARERLEKTIIPD
jgi:hypothetical protein